MILGLKLIPDPIPDPIPAKIGITTSLVATDCTDSLWSNLTLCRISGKAAGVRKRQSGRSLGHSHTTGYRVISL